eukprot:Em0006g372a
MMYADVQVAPEAKNPASGRGGRGVPPPNTSQQQDVLLNRSTQSLPCHTASGDNCTSGICPNTVVTYTCTITSGTAAGLTDWTLPTGTCPTNAFPDKIRLSQFVSGACVAQVEKGMHQADHHHGPLAHMLCLIYQEEHLMTQWLTAHSKNMDLAGCPEVKGSPLLGSVGEGHLLEISLLYCAQHVATIMPAILPCPCTGRKNTKRLLSQVTGQVVSQVTGQVVLQVTGQVVLQVMGQVVLQVTGQVVSQVTGQVVSQVTGQVVLQVTGQVVLQVTGQVVLQVTGQVVLQTNLTQFSHSPVEVHRSQGDIQHLALRGHSPVQTIKSGPLVATKDYLVSLEHHLLGLALNMEQSTRLKSSTEKTVHWFCALSESEPANTYLKVAMGNLAQTYESVEGHQIDTDDTLFIQSLQIM